MPERQVSFTVFAGESSDKDRKSGIGTGVFTEMKGLLPVPPAGDGRGAAMAAPGCVYHGDNTFAAVPGVHDEPDSDSPASDARYSSYYLKTRLCSARIPGIQGDVIAGFHCGKGSTDTRLGECLGLHIEHWGNRAPVGEITVPYTRDNYGTPAEPIYPISLSSVIAAPSGYGDHNWFSFSKGYDSNGVEARKYWLYYIEDSELPLGTGSDGYPTDVAPYGNPLFSFIKPDGWDGTSNWPSTGGGELIVDGDTRKFDFDPGGYYDYQYTWFIATEYEDGTVDWNTVTGRFTESSA